MTMKIGILQQFNTELVDKLKTLLPEHEVLQLDVKSSDILQQVKEIDILVGANASDEIIEAASNLKLFHVPWVGLDRINFRALQKRNIPICNSKWNDTIVAEYAVTLLLVGLKQLIPIHNNFKTGSWKLRPTPSKLLSNSKVLLIGFGSIGREVARFLRPFTSNVIALRNNPELSTSEEKQLVEKIIGWNEYNDEIKNIDYIINSLPLTPQTTGILTEERLYAMKEGAYYVNVGRGKTTDEKALFEVLQSKHLAGASIDVWYNYKSTSDSEPFYPSQYPFQELDNVIMSPHRAATFSSIAPDAVWSDVVFNIQALNSKKPLRNVISYDKRY